MSERTLKAIKNEIAVKDCNGDRAFITPQSLHNMHIDKEFSYNTRAVCKKTVKFEEYLVKLVKQKDFDITRPKTLDKIKERLERLGSDTCRIECSKIFISLLNCLEKKSVINKSQRFIAHNTVIPIDAEEQAMENYREGYAPVANGYSYR